MHPFALASLVLLTLACASEGRVARPASPASPATGPATAPATGRQPAAQDAFADPVSEAIEREELERHVRFLASDELEGRAAGSEGERRAAEYLARVLERAGFEPAGTEGFLQEVPLERLAVDGALRMTLEREGEPALVGEAGADFDLEPRAVRDGPLAVRVVRAPGDVGEPSEGVALFVDGSLSDLRAWLEEAGVPEARGFGLVVRAGQQRSREREARAVRERLRRRGAQEREAPRIGRVHGELLAALRSGSVRALRISGLRREQVSAWNVVGLLRGSDADPAAAERALVLSAHFDHIGLVDGAAEGEDRVHNGADDNASGTAAVLEIAEALASGTRPARALVVLLATAEELGMLGTDHYIEHPAWPLERTLYDLNLEMLGRPDEAAGGAGRLWLVGWDLTNVGPALAERGLGVVADPRPEQDFFWRSDNVPFVRRGVVAQTLSSYGMHADYHRPGDEADTLDYEHLARGARTALLAARAILAGELVPAWAEGFDPDAPRRR